MTQSSIYTSIIRQLNYKKNRQIPIYSYSNKDRVNRLISRIISSSVQSFFGSYCNYDISISTYLLGVFNHRSSLGRSTSVMTQEISTLRVNLQRLIAAADEFLISCQEHILHHKNSLCRISALVKLSELNVSKFETTYIVQ